MQLKRWEGGDDNTSWSVPLKSENIKLKLSSWNWEGANMKTWNVWFISQIISLQFTFYGNIYLIHVSLLQLQSYYHSCLEQDEFNKTSLTSIHPILFKTTNVNLLVVLHERSEDHQFNYAASSVNQECLYQLSAQSILLRYFSLDQQIDMICYHA